MGNLIRLDDRYAGDDWTFIATTDDDVSDHDGLVAEIRTSEFVTGQLVASTQGVEPTILTDGDPDLDVDATDFAAGRIVLLVPRSVTRNVAPGQVYLQLSVDAASLQGRRTIGTFTFAVLSQVAVEAGA